MYERKFIYGVEGDGQRLATCQRTVQAKVLGGVSDEIAASATATYPDMQIDVSELQGLFISSDKDLTLTFATANDPITLALKANLPYVWETQSYHACKLTEDTTGLSANNAGTETATLRIEVLSKAPA